MSKDQDSHIPKSGRPRVRRGISQEQHAPTDFAFSPGFREEMLQTAFDRTFRYLYSIRDFLVG